MPVPTRRRTRRSARRAPAIHPNITLELAEQVRRWMQRAEARWPDPADRVRFAARIRLLRVDLRRGDIAAVKRNLSHLEAAL